MSECCVQTTLLPAPQTLTSVQNTPPLQTTLQPPPVVQTTLGAQQGIPGPPGPPGPAGPPGNVVGADKYYAHDQMVPSAIWTVTHNLGKFPTVIVFDSDGSEVEGVVNMLNSNSLTIEFSAAFGGKAYCN